MENTFYGIAAAAAIALLLYFVTMSGIGQRPHDFPPGPPTIPILGNLHLVRHLIPRSNLTDRVDAQQETARAISKMGSRIWVWLSKSNEPR